MKITWHKGNPPHIGWWLCMDTSDRGDPMWRWWVGKNWSYPAAEYDSEHLVLCCAKSKAIFRNDEITWCDYWPEHARVPRIKP